ncbi:hypothetical protein HZS_69 [Henneguya salminicola]|nr:hypothetical protein HZS_69 [Henneguya salminicola]
MPSEDSNLEIVKDGEKNTMRRSQGRMNIFKNLLREVERNHSIVIKENVRLRLRIRQLENKLALNDPGRVDTDYGGQHHSFTKKMGIDLLLELKNAKTVNKVTQLFRISAHADCITDLSYRNSLITSASYDNTCKIWSADMDACHLVYRGHKSAVNSCRLSPVDSMYVCSGCGDGSVHVWSIKFALELAASMKTDPSIRPKVEGSADEWIDKGDLELGADKIVYLNKPIFELKSHDGPVSFADWTYDGINVISSSWDRTIVVWDVEKSKSITNFIGHEEEVFYVCCHPSQKLFLSTSADSTIRLWDMRTSKTPSVTICHGHNAEVNSALFSNSNIISGSSDKSSKVWDLRSMREPLLCLKTSSSITRMSINSEGHVCLPMRNGHFRIWYFTSKSGSSFYSQRNGHNKSIESSCWCESGINKYLYTCSIDGSIRRWLIQNSTTVIK